MRKILMASGLGLAAIVATPAAAQQTGAEIIGQTVDVRFADGSTNSITFDRSGRAMVRTSDGYSTGANWFVRNGQLCLQSASATECWAYDNAFVAGQARAVTSDCGSSSTWIARGVNAAPAPAQPVVAPVTQGERG